MKGFSLLCSDPIPISRQGRRMFLQVSPLAGFRHYRAGELWGLLGHGDVLQLVREPQNPHDSNAVQICWRYNKLGYLPRSENMAVARLLDQGRRVHARITRLRDDDDPWKRVEVALEVEMPATAMC